MRSRTGLFLFGAGFTYCYGALLGGMGLAWVVVFDRPSLPHWTWWGYVLAPFPIGLLALVFEGLGSTLEVERRLQRRVFGLGGLG